MLRIAYDVVKPILSFHVCTEAEKYFQTPWYWLQDNQVPVFHMEGYKLPAPHQCSEIKENANRFSYFLQ